MTDEEKQVELNDKLLSRSVRRGTSRAIKSLISGLLKDVEERKEDVKPNESLFEGRKLIFDALKHLTTLSTGSILLMTTFIDKIFNQPEWKFLIGATYLGFSLSVIFSIIVMLFIGIQRIGRFDEQTRFRKTEIIIGSGSVIFAFATFALSVLFLSVFVMKNLY